MSAQEQVGPALLGIGSRAVRTPTTGSAGLQTNRSTGRLRTYSTSTLVSESEERSIADVDLFRHFLGRETKRSERSGKPFVLAVFYLDLQHQDEQELLDRLRRGIFSAIRDTDFVGWYDENHSLGLLLTEIAEPNQATVAAVLKRIQDAIAAYTSPELLKDVTCRVFHKDKNSSSRSVEPCAMAGD
jgi:hypothetical protein